MEHFPLFPGRGICDKRGIFSICGVSAPVKLLEKSFESWNCIFCVIGGEGAGLFFVVRIKISVVPLMNKCYIQLSNKRHSRMK